MWLYHVINNCSHNMCMCALGSMCGLVCASNVIILKQWCCMFFVVDLFLRKYCSHPLNLCHLPTISHRSDLWLPCRLLLHLLLLCWPHPLLLQALRQTSAAQPRLLPVWIHLLHATACQSSQGTRGPALNDRKWVFFFFCPPHKSS